MLFPSWPAVLAVMGMAPLERVQEALARTPTAAIKGSARKRSSSAVWQSSTVKSLSAIYDYKTSEGANVDKKLLEVREFYKTLRIHSKVPSPPKCVVVDA